MWPYRSEAKTIVRLMLAGAVFVAAPCCVSDPSYAFGDAPWCAVMSLGTGGVYWDCEYRTIEECVPNVLAGNRGFCNLNPARGPSAGGGLLYRHHRWHHLKHRH